MSPDKQSVTQLLEAASKGDPSAGQELRSLFYERLRKLARRERQDQAEGRQVDTTLLIREVYDNLLGRQELHWISRYHFYKAAALAMRRLLGEGARKADRKDRSREEFAFTGRILDEVGWDALALDEALDRFQSIDPLACDVVHLRFLAGLSTRDTAKCLEVSEAAVEENWQFARAWLCRELEDDDAVAPQRPPASRGSGGPG